MKKSILKKGAIQVTNNVDVETGEVVSSQVKQFNYLANTKEDFMLMYTSLLGVMHNMSTSEIKVYTYLLMHYSSGFAFEIGKGMRTLLAKEFGMKDRSIQNTIYSLRNQHLIVSVGVNMYEMNPRYAFKGSTSERNKKLKTIIEVYCPEC